ncbi:anti-sigma factor antagonist [Streptomyces sp. NPDC007861]|uniref:STAS domain-containing protein n=1 Tax=Streptomyces sp. NPDC007861 TaxID=3154893 RepID=UPI0033D8BAD3
MSISWSVEEQRGVAVMSVAGFLGNNAIGRFSDGFNWVVTRSAGAVVLDFTELLGWSAEGEAAVIQAAAGLRSAGRPLRLCGLARLEVTALWAGHLDAMTVCSDLDSALNAEAPPAG